MSQPAFTLVQATMPEQVEAVRGLMRDFIAWSRVAQADRIDLIDQYFDADAYERSLHKLPGYFSPPRGSLMLALSDGEPAGCVALRDLGDGVCEMKRMYIADAFRSQGLGRKLADAVIADARTAGYQRMRLETSVAQPDAIRLYERSGFERIAAYNPMPPEMEGWLLAFELRL